MVCGKKSAFSGSSLAGPLAVLCGRDAAWLLQAVDCVLQKVYLCWCASGALPSLCSRARHPLPPLPLYVRNSLWSFFSRVSYYPCVCEGHPQERRCAFVVPVSLQSLLVLNSLILYYLCSPRCLSFPQDLSCSRCASSRCSCSLFSCPSIK